MSDSETSELCATGLRMPGKIPASIATFPGLN